MSRESEVLQARLDAFGIACCQLTRSFARDEAGRHFRKQLIKTSTSPAANYSEACEAESLRDFVHKLQVGLKELRETRSWLNMARGTCAKPGACDANYRECGELIAIFVSSVKTAKARLKRQEMPGAARFS